MGHHSGLVAPLGLLGDPLGQDPAAAGVVFATPNGESVWRLMHHRNIYLTFHQLGRGPMDIFQSFSSVEEKGAGRISDIVA